MNKTTETISKDKKSGKREYKFDLSDGLGAEDIGAIFIWIYKAILFILKVIFYPYYWITQEIGRTIHFIMNPHDGPLTEEEKIYVQSVPFFFMMFGFFIGILIGAIVIFIKIDDIRAFIDSFNFDVAVNFIVSIIQLFIDIIKFIVLGTWDVTTAILKGMYDIASKNVLITFIVLSTIGFFGFLLFLLITETDYLQSFLQRIKDFFNFIFGLPRRAYNWGNHLYLRIIRRLSNVVYGDYRLDYDMKFFRRVVGISMGFSLYILIILLGILFIQRPTQDVEQALLYAIISVIGFGFLCGIIAPYFLTRALDKITKGKYKATIENN